MPHDAASFRFTREQRLLKAPDFKRVFSQEKPFFTRHFVVHAVKTDLAHARIGIIVSKKVSKKAVIRNAIKRRIRNAFRLHATHIAPLDYVVVSRASCAKALDINNEVDLQNELIYILDKLTKRYNAQCERL